MPHHNNCRNQNQGSILGDTDYRKIRQTARWRYVILMIDTQGHTTQRFITMRLAVKKVCIGCRSILKTAAECHFTKMAAIKSPEEPLRHQDKSSYSAKKGVLMTSTFWPELRDFHTNTIRKCVLSQADFSKNIFLFLNKVMVRSDLRNFSRLNEYGTLVFYYRFVCLIKFYITYIFCRKIYRFWNLPPWNDATVSNVLKWS